MCVPLMVSCSGFGLPLHAQLLRLFVTRLCKNAEVSTASTKLSSKLWEILKSGESHVLCRIVVLMLFHECCFRARIFLLVARMVLALLPSWMQYHSRAGVALCARCTHCSRRCHKRDHPAACTQVTRHATRKIQVAVHLRQASILPREASCNRQQGEVMRHPWTELQKRAHPPCPQELVLPSVIPTRTEEQALMLLTLAGMMLPWVYLLKHTRVVNDLHPCKYIVPSNVHVISACSDELHHP